MLPTSSFFRCRTAAVLMAAALAVTANFASAFSHVVTDEQEISPDVIEMHGTYSLGSGEKLLGIKIVALDENGNEVSEASGKFGPRGNWSGSVGDFRMAAYAAVFTVSTPHGIIASWTKIRPY